MDAETEEITLAIKMAFSRVGIDSKFERLWLGHAEVPVGGRTISQCLEEMKQQGWNLLRCRATADFHGILCEYDFGRRIPMLQSNDTSPKTLASPLVTD